MAGASPRAVRVLCGFALVLAGFGVLGTAAWASPIRLVRVGRRPTLPAGASIAGALPATTPMHVTVSLNAGDPAALADYARAVSTIGSTLYRDYLTPRQFGRRFGATAAQLRAVQASLHAHGLRPGRVSANRLSIPVSATAGQLERAFSLSLLHLALPGRRTAIAATAAPSFDPGVAHSVQAVIGLDSVSAPRPLIRRAPPGSAVGALARPRVATGGPQACAAAQQAAPGQSAYTIDQIASAYGFSGLYGAGDLAAGVTVAVYELEPDDPSDISAYQACYGTHASIAYLKVDGGAGSGAGTGEAALDIETLIGLAPSAHVLVYQGPNANSGALGSGPYDTFSAIVNQDRAQVITVSWGECEPAQGLTSLDAEDTLFQQAAVQGQSIVAASGDNGSEDCNDNDGVPKPGLAVDDPASQPYVTGVGGTSLAALGPRPTEAVWNSASSGPGGPFQPGAGGGGASSVWPMPADQLAASPSLHVLQAGSSGSACDRAPGYCRQVPDVSADADPATGYLIYWNGTGGVGGAPAGWQGIGGTSAGAPVWAAVIALADATPACVGSSVGDADPALYRAAGSDYAADFNDVVSGNNDFTGAGAGQFAAAPGYDMASGLGTPNATALTPSLCLDTVRLTSPGTQRTTVHTTVNLRLAVRGARGAAVNYRATGLPPGLSLGAVSGRISGTPRRTGSFVVTIVARGANGAISSASFPWTIGAAPRVSGASLAGLGHGRPKLSFTVLAGRGAPPIETIHVSLPAGLRFVSAHSLAVSTPAGKRLRFAATVARSQLAIAFRGTAVGVRATVSYPGIRLSNADPSGIGQLAERTLVVSLGVIDSEHGSTRLVVKIKPSQ
jgi:subtilase family serine protease